LVHRRPQNSRTRSDAHAHDSSPLPLLFTIGLMCMQHRRDFYCSTFPLITLFPCNALPCTVILDQSIFSSLTPRFWNSLSLQTSLPLTLTKRLFFPFFSAPSDRSSLLRVFPGARHEAWTLFCIYVPVPGFSSFTFRSLWLTLNNGFHPRNIPQVFFQQLQ